LWAPLSQASCHKRPVTSVLSQASCRRRPVAGAVVRPIRHKRMIYGRWLTHPGDVKPILRYS